MNLENIFSKKELTWKKLILFAIIAGIYTAAMAILPITNDTSFIDITISFEVWILFGILIIMNSNSPKDSALKCFVFFLLSQPLVYLLQVPFSPLGFGLFGYYGHWFIWTICTLPMGYIGYYMKKDKLWGLLILTPILIFLGIHYANFLRQTIYNFPYHLLSTIFCFFTLIYYPLYIFKNKKVKITGFVISIIIIIGMTIFSLLNRNIYRTDIMVSGGKMGITFDNTYLVYLEDEKYGNVSIKYNEGIEDYLISAEFKYAGKTKLVLEDQDGNKEIFEIEIKNNSYEINRK